MCVYISDASGEKKVWDLYRSVGDRRDTGATADGVRRYRFAIRFDRTDGNGGVLLYAINGQRLDTAYLDGAGVNSAAPRIYADVAVKGTVDIPYVLPAPVAYDVSDGTIDGVRVRVLYKSTTVLSERVFVEGLTFTPHEAGEYTVRYTAVDAFGAKTVKNYDLPVTDAVGAETIGYDRAVVENEVGTGSKITLPIATVRSDRAVMRERGFAAALTVECDGVVLDGYDGVVLPADSQLTLDRAGTYRLTYTATNPQLNCTDAREIAVRDGLPAIGAIALRPDYAVGKTVELDLPAFTHNETQKTATATLVYPSGAAYSGMRHTLNEAGRYELRLSAAFDGKTVENVYRFAAYDAAYTVGRRDSASYGATEYLKGREGLNVTLDRGSAFALNTTVDLVGMTKEDRLLSLYITPETAGTYEAYGVEVRITDVYDENNYIVVQSQREIGEPRLSYIRACIGTGTFVGHMGSTSWDYSIVHRGNEHGRVVRMSAAGVVPETYSEITPFELYYDYGEQALYIGGTGVAGWNNRLVCDFDDPFDFTDTFQGFTTGEVKIEIRPFRPCAEKFNFFIEEIAGVDIMDKYARDDAPTVEVKTPQGAIPTAQIGKPYPVFAATATAPRMGEVPVSAVAMLDYGSSSAAAFDVVDGKFTPTIPGRYTLVYSAENLFGATTVKTVSFDAVKVLDGIAVSADSVETTAITGESVEVSPTVTGGSGAYAIDVVVADAQGNACAVENGAFVPQNAGVYTVTYTVTDHIGNKATAKHTVTVTAKNTAVFEGEPRLPAAFVDGMTYTLPTVYAIDYTSGTAERVAATVSVVCNGTPLEATDGKFIPRALSSGDKATVTYTVAHAEPLNYEIPVMRVKEEIEEGFFGYDITQHFVAENMTVTATAPDPNDRNDKTHHGVTLEATAVNAWGEYVLPLVAGVFDVELEVSNAENAKRVDLYLSDWLDPTQCVKVSLCRGNSKDDPSILYINDSTQYSVAGSFFDVSDARFRLTYRYNLKRLSDNARMNALFDKTFDGKTFDGFASGYLRMRFEIPDGIGSVTLRYLNGQLMSAATATDGDGGAPAVFIVDGDRKTYDVGSEIALPKAYAADVLDYAIEYFVVTLRDPDNNVVTDKNGTELKNVAVGGDYIFTAAKSGIYTLTYGVRDASGNMESYMHLIRVSDREPPVITLSGAPNGTYRAGDTIVLPEATATDAKGDVEVYVFAPDGMVTPIDNGKYAVPAKTGLYTVKYIAFDAYGNMASVTVTFTVE